MKGRAAPIFLGLLAIVVAGGGCSGELGGEDLPWPPPNSRALDREVLALEQGMSAGEIEEALGDPDRESTFELEDEPGVWLLFYGYWQLRLEEDALTERIKYLFARPSPREAAEKLTGRDLDRAIYGLELGTSMAAIKSVLGTPAIYTIRSDAPEKEEVLTYSQRWDLTFVDGALSHRQRW